MVFAAATVCMIFALFSGNVPTAGRRLDEAQKYFDEMDYDNAIAVYNDMLRSGSKSTNVYLGLAEAYLKKGNEEKAVEILERGLDYAGDDSRFYKMLYRLTGDSYYAEAEEELTWQDTPDEPVLPDVTAEDPAVTPDNNENEAAPGTEAAVTEPPAPETTASRTEETSAAETAKPPETTAPAETASSTAAAATAKAMVKIPDFTGMSITDAADLARSLNIDLEPEYKDNSEYEHDTIYSQSPEAGSEVSERSSVTVYVSVNRQPTEEELNVLAFFNAAKEWGDLNSNVTGVKLNDKSSAVTITLSSAKRLSLDSSVMEAFAKCKSAVMILNSPVMSVTINSSSVTKAGKLNLSTDIHGNEKRMSIDIGTSGKLSCTAVFTILDCDISSDDLKNMNLYYNNKKLEDVSVGIDADGNPVITVSSGGSYVIR